jgi:hypothetical protein
MDDILEDLKKWLALLLVTDDPHRKGEFLQHEISLIKRAIMEIERLRAAKVGKGEA